MVGSQHDAVSLAGAQTTQIAKGQRKVIAVYVTKAGSAGSKLNLRNGTANTDTILFTVEGEAVLSLPIINKTFGAGLYAEVATGGNYLVIYE